MPMFRKAHCTVAKTAVRRYLGLALWCPEKDKSFKTDQDSHPLTIPVKVKLLPRL